MAVDVFTMDIHNVQSPDRLKVQLRDLNLEQKGSRMALKTMEKLPRDSTFE